LPFFGGRMIGIALAEIVLLLAAVALTAVLFWRMERAAALLLVPYAAWVGFIVALNAALWRLKLFRTSLLQSSAHAKVGCRQGILQQRNARARKSAGLSCWRPGIGNTPARGTSCSTRPTATR